MSLSRTTHQHGTFRCRNSNCRNKKKSQAAGTWFESARLPLTTIFELMYMFAHNFTYEEARRETASEERDTVLSFRTAADWYSYCREAVVVYEIEKEEERPMIGGPGKIVQMDESKFGKRKYNRGRQIEGHWIIGMIEDGSDDLRLEVCPNNGRTYDNEVMNVPILEDKMVQGTVKFQHNYNEKVGITAIQIVLPGHTIRILIKIISEKEGCSCMLIAEGLPPKAYDTVMGIVSRVHSVFKNIESIQDVEAHEITEYFKPNLNLGKIKRSNIFENIKMSIFDYFIKINPEIFSGQLINKPERLDSKLWACKKYLIIKSLYGNAVEFKKGKNPETHIPEGKGIEIVNVTGIDFDIDDYTDASDYTMVTENPEGIRAHTVSFSHDLDKWIKEMLNISYRAHYTLFVKWEGVEGYDMYINPTICKCSIIVDTTDDIKVAISNCQTDRCNSIPIKKIKQQATPDNIKFTDEQLATYYSYYEEVTGKTSNFRVTENGGIVQSLIDEISLIGTEQKDCLDFWKSIFGYRQRNRQRVGAQAPLIVDASELPANVDAENTTGGKLKAFLENINMMVVKTNEIVAPTEEDYEDWFDTEETPYNWTRYGFIGGFAKPHSKTKDKLKPTTINNITFDDCEKHCSTGIFYKHMAIQSYFEGSACTILSGIHTKLTACFSAGNLGSEVKVFSRLSTDSGLDFKVIKHSHGIDLASDLRIDDNGTILASEPSRDSSIWPVMVAVRGGDRFCSYDLIDLTKTCHSSDLHDPLKMDSSCLQPVPHWNPDTKRYELSYKKNDFEDMVHVNFEQCPSDMLINIEEYKLKVGIIVNAVTATFQFKRFESGSTIALCNSKPNIRVEKGILGYHQSTVLVLKSTNTYRCSVHVTIEGCESTQGQLFTLKPSVEFITDYWCANNSTGVVAVTWNKGSSKVTKDVAKNILPHIQQLENLLASTYSDSVAVFDFATVLNVLEKINPVGVLTTPVAAIIGKLGNDKWAASQPGQDFILLNDLNIPNLRIEKDQKGKYHILGNKNNVDININTNEGQIMTYSMTKEESEEDEGLEEDLMALVKEETEFFNRLKNDPYLDQKVEELGVPLLEKVVRGYKTLDNKQKDSVFKLFNRLYDKGVKQCCIKEPVLASKQLNSETIELLQQYLKDYEIKEDRGPHDEDLMLAEEVVLADSDYDDTRDFCAGVVIRLVRSPDERIYIDQGKLLVNTRNFYFSKDQLIKIIKNVQKFCYR
ncbi:hypothetical protein ACJJTC_018844 [Scirpophaga incertulas]